MNGWIGYHESIVNFKFEVTHNLGMCNFESVLFRWWYDILIYYAMMLYDRNKILAMLIILVN